MKSLLVFQAPVIPWVCCARCHFSGQQFLYIDFKIQAILINSINYKTVGSKYADFVIPVLLLTSHLA